MAPDFTITTWPIDTKRLRQWQTYKALTSWPMRTAIGISAMATLVALDLVLMTLDHGARALQMFVPSWGPKNYATELAVLAIRTGLTNQVQTYIAT